MYIRLKNCTVHWTRMLIYIRYWTLNIYYYYSYISTESLHIILNIEGRTSSKAPILSDMCTREHCQYLFLQETHRPTNLLRLKISGMSLVAERPHKKYGSAILIRDDLKVENINERVQGTVEIITIVMPGVVVHSVYKPPNNPLNSQRSAIENCHT